MDKAITLSIMLAVTGASATAALAAKPASHSYAGAELAAGAKVTIAQARSIALKARPGRLVNEELEKEAGGSGLRYSFDIAKGGKTFEVGVDAADGKILENGAESAAKERAEVRAEAKPASAAK